MSLKKMVLINIVVLLLLASAGMGIFYAVNQSRNYIKTDFAKIDGHRYTIVSPVSGKVSEWKGNNGNEFGINGVLGKVATEKEDKVVNVAVTTPAKVTVVQSNITKGSLVAQGTPLAYAYDMEDLYVTANIEEVKINDIQLNQKVDIYIDAFKDTTLKGKITEIGLSTAGEFSLLPQSNSNANYTKVTQVIPVKIKIEDTKGQKLLPGMNTSVRIHK